MRRLASVLGGGTLAVALTAQVWSGAWAAPSTGADPTPTVVQTGAVTVVIPGTSSPTSSSSPTTGSGGSGGGSGGGDDTPVPTPVPTAAPAPPDAPGAPADGLKLDHKRIATEEWMVAIGTGFQPGEKVQLVLYSSPLVVDSFTADASGRFEARFKIPKKMRLGTHTAEATGWISAKVANQQFTIVSAPQAAGAVPFIWWLLGVLGVLLIGAVATAVYFRHTIAGWFGAAPLQASGSPT